MHTQIAAGWMQTHEGRRFYPLAPNIDDVLIEDIAHALSQQCRFAGHTARFYSVAEHSVRVSQATQWFAEREGMPCHKMAAADWCDAVDFLGHICGPHPGKLLLAALLHDAQEAYLQDMITPLKSDPDFGRAYRSAEFHLEGVIADKFGLPVFNPLVKRADHAMLRVEQRDLMGMTLSTEDEKLVAGLAPADGWEPRTAKAVFLNRFMELSIG